MASQVAEERVYTRTDARTKVRVHGWHMDGHTMGARISFTTETKKALAATTRETTKTKKANHYESLAGNCCRSFRSEFSQETLHSK